MTNEPHDSDLSTAAAAESRELSIAVSYTHLDVYKRQCHFLSLLPVVSSLRRLIP